MNVKADIDAVLARAKKRGLTHFTQGYFDHNGQLRSKQVHIDALAGAFDEGVALHTGVFTTAPDGSLILESEFSDPAAQFRDARLVFDATAVRDTPLSGREDGLLCIGRLEGSCAAVCPRTILDAEVARLEALGFAVEAAFEFEFRLLEESRSSLTQRTPDAVKVLSGTEWFYSFADQTTLNPLLEEFATVAAVLGVPVEAWHTELTELVEFALKPAPAVRAADNAGLFRAAAKAVAKRHGLMASFMARLNAASQGASGHLNLSLFDAKGRALFTEHGAGGGPGEALWHFLGGLERYTPELMLAFAPNLNSYRRFEPGLFTPLNVSWGVDNKTVAFRVAELTAPATRIENRLPGADVHPHLALTAMLAAGRRGIVERLEPGPAVVGDAWSLPETNRSALPIDFEAAISAFETSSLAREVFGERFVSAYVTSRRWQQRAIAGAVTDRELRMFAEGA